MPRLAKARKPPARTAFSCRAGRRPARAVALQRRWHHELAPNAHTDEARIFPGLQNPALQMLVEEQKVTDRRV